MDYFDRSRTRTEGTWRGYAGHETYNGIGIVHMKGRIYDPTLGRFLQPDPIVEDDLNPQTWNRYTYVRNNPMTFTDPTGLATDDKSRKEKYDERHEDDCTFTTNCGKTGPGQPKAGGGCNDVTPPGSVPAASSNGSMSGARSQSDGDRLCGSNNQCRGAYDKVLSLAEIFGLIDRLAGGEGVHIEYAGLAPQDRCDTPLCNNADARREYQKGQNIAEGVMLAGGEAQALIAAKPTTSLASGGAQALRAEASLADDVATAGSIRTINPTRGGSNCVNCVIATDATLAGHAASALPGGPTPIRVLERLFGARFSAHGNIDDVAAAMSFAGNGARGIVFGSRGRDVGHVFNVVNQKGTVRFLDGQTGRAATFDGYDSFKLLRTNAP